ncbi:T-cell activation Rho GTPase-activating protein-like [Grus americana]|uniref:T-cell activation Rho GTPase-activating protein-like n=1 Tax=Grus americana TaxID=9117 RepID=UPI002407CD38|nr:T-cell activation Rho GTPase-activating protein-like [Grus americana]
MAASHLLLSFPLAQATTLHASSLQRLVQGQAQAGAEQRPPPVPSGGSSERGLGPSAGGTRRRRRGLPWPFARRRGSSAAAEAAGQSGSGGRGALFGQPLAALCSQDGTLPQPIQVSKPGQGVPIPLAPADRRCPRQRKPGWGSGTKPDLLALLAEHGPSTEGIFRLAVKEHVSRELREALDSGAEVHLESQPAHVLAVLLKWAPARAGAKSQPPAREPECRGCCLCSRRQRSKPHPEPLALQDFLRKIPSKLLGAELYEEWMSALQKTSRQEKLAALREVAGKLPQANLLLLKSLLSLLQRISRNAASSRMTAGNLAICVGPNLLSPPEEQTLPLDALVQVTGQVTGLVEFLIEHHGDLFGEEVAGLAGTSAEESPAPGLEAETAEVPPVAVESQHLKSSSGERSLPGPSQESRKRKLTCEEGSDGHPGRKRRRLERELSGMGD